MNPSFKKSVKWIAVLAVLVSLCRVLWTVCGRTIAMLREEPSVSWDAEKRTVSFTARYSGCGVDAPLEFLFAARGSDHDYETLFLTDAGADEIAAAFGKAGFPSGGPIDRSSCRFWPTGAQIALSPDFSTLVKDSAGATPKMLYTGGERAADGALAAATNGTMPVFALYDMPASIVQFDDALEQSANYGRFHPARSFEKDGTMTFTFSLAKADLHKRIEVAFEPGRAAEALKTLREAAADGRELDAMCVFSPRLQVEEAAGVAAALAMLDSPKVKINGAREGELFFRAYLPLEKWRDRKERLAQPPEVRLGRDGAASVTEIIEDWSEPGSLDPKLTSVEKKYATFEEAAKAAAALAQRTSSILVYVAPGEKLETIYRFKRLAGEGIANWYVFVETPAEREGGAAK